jgi:hypothetical protein
MSSALFQIISDIPGGFGFASAIEEFWYIFLQSILAGATIDSPPLWQFENCPSDHFLQSALAYTAADTLRAR